MNEIIWTVITAATPILFAALGEMVVERSGVLNLGVEGMMIAGALAGFAAASATGSADAGFVVAALAGAGMAMIFGLLTQFALTTQVPTGLALALFGLGVSAMFGKPFEGVKTPVLAYDWVAILGLVMVPVLAWWLTRTRGGLILRAVGENPVAAHGLGHKVRAIRLGAIAFGGAMAGIGGAYIAIARILQWSEGLTAGAGWIALAIVVFAGWRPWGVLAGAWLFGGVTMLQLRLQAMDSAIPVQLLSITPYLATIIVLVLISARNSRHGGAGAPAALGTIFHPPS